MAHLILVAPGFDSQDAHEPTDQIRRLVTLGRFNNWSIDRIGAVVGLPVHVLERCYATELNLGKDRLALALTESLLELSFQRHDLATASRTGLAALTPREKSWREPGAVADLSAGNIDHMSMAEIDDAIAHLERRIAEAERQKAEAAAQAEAGRTGDTETATR